jgi:NAD(P)-dependent dehydrogenase (short-subunit alcohol dehydrogenase family)
MGEDMNLGGKTAIVTGAARGLGAACASAFAERGAKVFVADLDDIDPADSAVPMEKVRGSVRMDVSNLDDWSRTLVHVAQAEGGLDILHLNAGVVSRPLGAAMARVFEDEPLDWVTAQCLEKVMSVNVTGVVNGIIAALPYLRQSRGSIVITGSDAGVMPFPQDPLYSMSKHAVVGLTRSLGPVLEKQGISIAAVCPTGVDTRMIPAELRTGELRLTSPSFVADIVRQAIEADCHGDVWVVSNDGTMQRFAWNEPIVLQSRWS